jgi:hypothetical protein
MGIGGRQQHSFCSAGEIAEYHIDTATSGNRWLEECVALLAAVEISGWERFVGAIRPDN